MTAGFGANARLIDARSGEILHGPLLRDRVEALRRELDQTSVGLIVLPAAWTADSVCRYLAALWSARPVALVAPDLPADDLAAFARRFGAALVWTGAETAAPEGFTGTSYGWTARNPSAAVHPDLAVLLTTSGSTGQARMVRLSRGAVEANASAIAKALALSSAETAPTSMPFHFGYGLSVLNSHLAAHATIAVIDAPTVGADFWKAVDRHRVTSFAGVPHLYELLDRLRWSPTDHPTVRVLTQSGSRMRPDLIERLASAVDGRLHLMYGQTEATARLAVLPWEELPKRPGSVGVAVPGSRLSVRTAGGETTDPSVEGEVIFRGPSVMMGYADTAVHLAKGDELAGVLHTGDLGEFDEDGYLYLRGRLKRLAKVFGVRINLDGAEHVAARAGAPGPVAAVAPGDDAIVLWCLADATGDELAALASRVAKELRLSRRMVQARVLDRFPLLGNGKIDYVTLASREWR